MAVFLKVTDLDFIVDINKYPRENNLREKRCILAHSFRGFSPSQWERMVEQSISYHNGQEASRERENTCSMDFLFSAFLFYLGP
jgi:hypothetical protein